MELPIKVTTRGNLKQTKAFLKSATSDSIKGLLHKYGAMGVEALSNATPIATGKTAASWAYKIEISNGRSRIVWTNSNVVDGNMIAILLQYGHGTRNGGYVQGIDYINPALKPIFEQFSKDLWSEVIK